MEGLTSAHQSAIQAYILYNLMGMAYGFLLEGKPAQCVTLLAAVHEIARSAGFKIKAELQQPYDRALAQARQKLTLKRHGQQVKIWILKPAWRW
jgi:hypothetical protein